MAQQLAPLKIFICTWNMGNAPPKGWNSILSHKCIPGETGGTVYDIICLGLQESTYSEQIDQASVNGCIVNLTQYITESLGDSYQLLEHCQRAQLQMFLFVQKSLTTRITDIERKVENTGFLHLFPNKGGLLVSLTVDGTKLAFVSCHLTAHEGVKHCEERNSSIVEILGGARTRDIRFDVAEQSHHIFWMGDMNYRTTFSAVEPKTKTKNPVSKEGGSTEPNSPVTPDDIALVRADNSDSSDDEKPQGRSKEMSHVYELIAKENWETILQHDELNREIRSTRVLNGFTALQPHFPPTFKRIRHVGITKQNDELSGREYNLEYRNPPIETQEQSSSFLSISKKFSSKLNEESSTSGKSKPPSSPDRNSKADSTCEYVDDFYDKKRIPSYTDRVLFKSAPIFAGNIHNDFFESCETVSSSDHKPVIAGFTVQTIPPSDRYIRVFDGIFKSSSEIKKLDSKESSKLGNQVLELRFSHLKGHNLAEMDSQVFGGGSDPYIMVTVDPPMLLLTHNMTHSETFATEGSRSSVIKHDLNPDWKNETLSIKIASIDIERLCDVCSVVVSVWDEDLLRPDDLIGVFTIPMKKIIDSYRRSINSEYFYYTTSEVPGYSFNEPLRNNSEITGYLSGCISLKGDLATISKRFDTTLASQVTLSNAFVIDTLGCNCNIA